MRTKIPVQALALSRPVPMQPHLFVVAAFAVVAMLPVFVQFLQPASLPLAWAGPVVAGLWLTATGPGDRLPRTLLGLAAGAGLLVVNWLVAVEGGCCATLR